MEDRDQPQKIPEKTWPSRDFRSLRRSRTDQKWDSHKADIHLIYVVEKNTLQMTMRAMEEKYSFKASERKWKMKLKEWKFDKYLSTKDMNIIIAKREKRSREEGKETVFFHGRSRITSERMHHFKKRKTMITIDMTYSSAATPPNVTYRTPEPELRTCPEGTERKGTNNAHVTLSTTTIHENSGQREAESDMQNLSEEMQLIDFGQPRMLVYTAASPIPAANIRRLHSLIQDIDRYPVLLDVTEYEIHNVNITTIIGEEAEPSPKRISVLVREVIKMAQADVERGEIYSSQIKYLTSIIIYGQSPGHNRMTLFRNVSEFLELLEIHSPRFPYLTSLPTLHQLLVDVESAFGASASVTTRTLSIFADLLGRSPMYEFPDQKDTEAIYQRMIAYFNQQGNPQELFRWQLSLADLLLRLQRSDESVLLLASAIGDYLVNHDLASLANESLMAEILDSRKLNIAPCWDGVKSVVGEMRDILVKKLRNPALRDDFELSVQMLHEIVSLGSVFSALSCEAAAELLFSAVIPKLDCLSDFKFGIFKAQGYFERCRLYFSQRKYRNSIDGLSTVYKYITEGSRRQALQRDLVDRFTEVRKIVQQHLSASPDSEHRSMAKELDGMGLDSGLLEVPDRPSTSNWMELDNTGTNTPDTGSIKYGLTYSVSEITGVSNSVFLAP